ncbi:MAG: thermonuclease family protein [Hyphomonadaceae bacterium]|nr:thermonuclease family protein [Hyphomonadaceae bacterium]
MNISQPAVAQPAVVPAACAGLEPGPLRTITTVIDGETVGLDDGRALRLIGALAPRAMDVGAEPGAWEAENRTREALRAVVLGKSIALGFGGERIDRYGRLQAHAHLIEGNERRWVQGHLLRQGLARAYTAAGNRACAHELLAAEAEARNARRGLWVEAAYRIRSADTPAELLRHRTTFQIIEGRIARVAQVRSVIYLSFDRSWRQAFSVSLRREDRRLLGDFADDVHGMEGRLVRVRGWIEQRGSAPRLDLTAAGQIEVMDGVQSRAERVP